MNFHKNSTKIQQSLLFLWAENWCLFMNKTKCCSCLLYVDRVELAQERGNRCAALICQPDLHNCACQISSKHIVSTFCFEVVSHPDRRTVSHDDGLVYEVESITPFSEAFWTKSDLTSTVRWPSLSPVVTPGPVTLDPIDGKEGLQSCTPVTSCSGTEHLCPPFLGRMTGICTWVDVVFEMRQTCL